MTWLAVLLASALVAWGLARREASTLRRDLTVLGGELASLKAELTRLKTAMGAVAGGGGGTAEGAAATKHPATGHPAAWEPPMASPHTATGSGLPEAPHPHEPLPAAPLPAAPLPAAPLPTTDWEARLGGRWAFWVGAAAVFLSLAFFLAQAWGAVPPAGRLGLGLAAGGIAIATGRRLRARGGGERWFGEGLMGVGLGMAYLCIWAGARRYGLYPDGAAFAGMALATAGGVGLAVRDEAPALCAAASLGGYLAPLMIGIEDPAMIYLGILDAGLLGASLFRRWRGTIWLGFVATTATFGAWAVERGAATAAPLLGLGHATLHFGLFAGAATFYSLRRREATASPDLLLLLAAAFLYAGEGLWLGAQPLGEWLAGFPLALAVLFGAAAALPRRALPGPEEAGRTPLGVPEENLPLRRAAQGLAVFFLSIALPVRLSRDWLAVGWSAEFALLATLARAFRDPLLRTATRFVAVAAGLALTLSVLTHREAPLWHVPLLDAQSLPLLMGCLALAWVAWGGYRDTHPEPPPSPTEPPPPASPWDPWAHGYEAAALLAGALLLALQADHLLDWGLVPAVGGLETAIAIAALWPPYALAARRLAPRSASVGVAGLGLLALSALLVAAFYLFEGGQPPLPFANARTVAALALGLALAAWRGSPLLFAAGAVVVIAALTGEVGLAAMRWAPSAPREAAVILARGLWWGLAGAALLLLPARPGLPRLATLLGLGGLAAGLWSGPPSTSLPWLPLLNLRAADLAASTWLLTARAGAGPRVALAAVAAALLGITLEIQGAFAWAAAHGASRNPLASQMAISLAWSLFATGLLIAGLRRQNRLLRLTALALLGLTSCKVFLFDLHALDTSSRVLSFGGLGLALLAVSWLYGRLEKSPQI